MSNSPPDHSADTARETGMTFVKCIPFEQVQERYKDYVFLERVNGIVTCRMHTRGGPLKFSLQWHNAMPMLWRDIGADPENEVLILTATDDVWMVNPGLSDHVGDYIDLINFDNFVHDGVMLLESMIDNIDIPTIAAINGGGLHHEIGLLCDIVIASDNATFSDLHFPYGMVPGDGLTVTYLERMGITRTAHMAFLGIEIDAAKAVEWSLIQECVPKDKLMARAMEIAEFMMKRPRPVRRLTHMVIKRRWREVLYKQFGFAIAHENLALMLGDK